MPVNPSSLSRACEGVRGFLSASLQSRNQPSRVTVGNLAEAEPANSSDPDRVNLLFYRVEPDGSVLGSQPTDPWLLRLHLLVTAFAADETPSVGQNDLRLLGEVAAVFHEKPILDVVDVEGEAVRLNVVPETLTTEMLNQLWSVQGEVGFRPSLGYEVALAPIVPSERQHEVTLVGETVVSADPLSDPPPAGAHSMGRGNLRLVGEDHDHLVRFADDDAGLAGFTARVWVTSPDVDEVDFVWELLPPAGRWRRLAPDFGAGAGGPFAVHADDDRTEAVAVQAHQVPLPVAGDRPAAGPYQLVLRAVRGGSPLSDPALDGDPILVFVTRSGP